jgi:hypothetical protein
MESTGDSNRIQVSQATSDRLTELGKGDWLRPREEMVEAKGKGLVKTYWLASRRKGVTEPNEQERFTKGNSKRLMFAMLGKQMSTRMGFSDFSDSEHSDTEEEAENDIMMKVGNMSVLFEDGGGSWKEKEELKSREKLINWQSGLLARALRAIVARRFGDDPVDISDLNIVPEEGTIVLEEVVEAIELPDFDANAVTASIDPDQVSLSPAAISQLRDYVAMIASMYPSNAFHNFKHATHTVMAASKLLSRIVVPNCMDVKVATERHISTDGINSDPLTQFAVIFSALIHDVDHPGVPNSQLAKEEKIFAKLYKNKSIAEQKSFDLSWDLLMDSKYLDLRACIYSNEIELRRFRQLVVNCVMATDIFDKDMAEFRDKRWKKEFGKESNDSLEFANLGNRRATSVIEHISQVSTIAHTMQHWHVYRKWTECLFRERLEAYKHERAEEDPAVIWYESQLLFFDNYVIPLARRLEDCEVFGIASNECLSYALDNREEWVSKGHEVVREMMENATFDLSESVKSITFDDLKH